MSLIHRFHSNSASWAEDTAVVDSSGRHTYGDLSSLSLRTAGHLLDNRIEPGDRVGLLLSNSFEYIGIFYGIWAAGGVTVALNTQAKAKDLANWLDHSGSGILFADDNHPEFSDLRQSIGGRVRIIPVPRGSRSENNSNPSSEWKDITDHPGLDQPKHTADDAIASIIYTSGTTGSPKGVTLTHRNLLSNTLSILEYLALTREDSIVNVLPFYYSYGNSIMHTHLAAGARIVLENSLLYPQKILDRIREESVTGFSGVPSTYSLLINRTQLNGTDLESLRYMTQAGGPMPPAVADKLQLAVPDANLFIMYGQTEASARLTYLPPEVLKRKRGSIGIPIPGVDIEIRNKSDDPVSPYVTGEICARGENIMQGYWHDEQKTAEVLRAGWLHTGDLGHYDEEGYLYIDGRSSEMIKTGGNRVSPQEIEEIISELDGVFEVAAKGVPDELLGEVIKAYIVLDVNHPLSKMEILRHCKNNLAIYKIPKQVEFIDKIPRTASGKIRRHLLD